MNVRTMVGVCVALMMLGGCGESKEKFEKSFKESFEKSFVKSCTESATKNGLAEAQAKEKCSCVAKSLVSKLSVTELAKLTNAESVESRKIFGEAIDSCK